MIKGAALKGGNRFSLVLGLGLGVVAAILIAVYLSGAKSDGGGGSVSGPAVPVVVAKVEIPSGTKIDLSMVEVKSFPEGGLLTGAFEKPEDVVDRVTTTRVVAGEQVIASKITAVGSNIGEFGENPPLSVVVTQGLRGTSVEVNSIVSAGGNVRPGDKVDVILTVEVAAGDPGDTNAAALRDQISAIILQDLQVLAIDTAVAQGTGAAPEDQKDTDEKATTVTLLATPAQSEVLVLADACRANHGGRIGLAVRSYGDTGRFDQRSEWPAAGEPPTCAGLFGLQFLP